MKRRCREYIEEQRIDLRPRSLQVKAEKFAQIDRTAGLDNLGPVTAVEREIGMAWFSLDCCLEWIWLSAGRPEHDLNDTELTFCEYAN